MSAAPPSALFYSGLACLFAAILLQTVALSQAKRVKQEIVNACAGYADRIYSSSKWHAYLWRSELRLLPLLMLAPPTEASRAIAPVRTMMGLALLATFAGCVLVFLHSRGA